MRVVALLDFYIHLYPALLRERGWEIIEPITLEEAKRIIEPHDVILTESMYETRIGELLQLFPSTPIVFIALSQWVVDRYGKPMTPYVAFHTNFDSVVHALQTAVEEMQK